MRRSKPIRIAIFSKDLGAGGIQRSLLNLLNTMSGEQYEIDLYLFSKHVFFGDKIPSNVHVAYCRQNRLLSRFLPFGIYYFFKRHKANTSYDYSIDFDGFLNAQSALALKTPAKSHIIWVHTEICQLYKFYADRPLGALFYFLMHVAGRNRWKNFDTVVGVSAPIIEPIKKRFPDKKYIVIPNGVNSAEILKASKAQSSIKFDESKYNLVSVGRLSPPKNYPKTIEEIARTLGQRSDLHFYIVGDGIEEARIRKAIKKYALEKQVTLLGSSKNPYKYLRQADGFILNSKLEGQGISLLEAEIFGLHLFFPERLAKYVPELAQKRKDLGSLMSVAKNTTKKTNLLDEYNNDITSSLKKLLN